MPSPTATYSAMETCTRATKPLALLKQAFRQCRAERQRQRQQTRTYATAIAKATYPSLQLRKPRFPLPSPGFRPSQAIKQNRFDEGLRKIRVFPAPRSTIKHCPDPIKAVTESQLTVLDPTGARTRLFALSNPDRVQPGDILLVRLRNGDPFAGVCIHIRQRHSPIDTAILLRNQLTRIGVEMWFKIYSPNVEAVEIVQRKEKRARRAKLTYMRNPKHDMGSVEGIVRQYTRQKAGGVGGRMKSRDTNSGQKKKKNKKGKK